MAVLDAAALVAAWAAATTADGAPGHPARVEPLLRATVPGWPQPEATMAAWDHALVSALAAISSRTHLDAVTSCPACGLRLDVGLQLPAAVSPVEPVDQVMVALDSSHPHGPVTVTARTPTLADLDAALAAADGQPTAAIPILVDLLVTSVSDGQGPVGDDRRAVILARDDTLATLDAAIAQAQPAALAQAQVMCPSCDHRWAAPVHLDAFLWAAADRAAGALLDEVDRLAGSYGWTHDAILALHPVVRRQYLERVG